LIKWQDDGASPSLAQFGAASIAIYVGNAIQQVSLSEANPGDSLTPTPFFLKTQLQVINSNVNVANTSSIQFVPNPSIGPDSNE